MMRLSPNFIRWAIVSVIAVIIAIVGLSLKPKTAVESVPKSSAGNEAGIVMGLTTKNTTSPKTSEKELLEAPAKLETQDKNRGDTVQSPNILTSEQKREAVKEKYGLDDAFIDRINAELKQSAIDGNWKTLEDLADELEQKVPNQNYSFALFLAIKHDAPLYVIELFLDKGAQFNYQHLFVIAKLDKYQRYRELKQLGLNVHMTSPTGKNALFPAIDLTKQNRVFLYFLRDKVNPNIQVKGRDLLTFCLQQILRTDPEKLDRASNRIYVNAASYFSHLINYNAKLQANHIEMLKEIKETRVRIFDYMLRNNPELESMI